AWVPVTPPAEADAEPVDEAPTAAVTPVAPAEAAAPAAEAAVDGPAPELPVEAASEAAVAAAAPTPSVPAHEGGAPADDDLRAWFGDGPFDAPAAVSDDVSDDASDAVTTPPEGPDASQPADEEPPSDFHAELERFAQGARTTSGASAIAILPATAREDTGVAAVPVAP